MLSCKRARFVVHGCYSGSFKLGLTRQVLSPRKLGVGRSRAFASTKGGSVASCVEGEGLSSSHSCNRTFDCIGYGAIGGSL